MSEFYSRALELKRRGYTVVPIKNGKKGPSGEEAVGWEDNDPTEQTLKRLSLNGYANGNIGINTRHTPAIDLDVLDETMAQAMEDWLVERFGDTCVRIGRFPKRLLVFRTDRPFRKLQATFTDGATKHKVEILGAGQQFVAYGIHPDTQNPYYYTSLEEPLICRVEELPVLTHSDAVDVLENLIQFCKDAGWKLVNSSMGREESDTDDFNLETLKPVMQITEDTVAETLDWIDDHDDFGTYVKVGMALHHQFGGAQRGLELWHEWSEKSSKYDAGDVNHRWSTFGHGPATVTFASIVYQAKAARENAVEEKFNAALNRIDTSNDKREIRTTLAKELMSVISSDLQYDEAVRRVQRRLGELSEGAKPRLESVRKELDKAKPKNEKRVDLPSWCENWYFVADDGLFYNSHTGLTYSKGSFDSVYGEQLVTDDMRARGEAFGGRASDMALNLYRIPKVYSRMYLPGHEELVRINGLECVNTYNPWMEPKAEEPKTPDARKAIKLAEKHFEILFPDAFERETFLDYLAYTVQFPKEKINWAVLIQGVDGGGKSWFASLMSAVLGGRNVRTIAAESLKENFTKWAEGSRMVFFEEIRLRDDTRFEILDKLKPYMANPTVPVRRMQKDGYEIVNVTNYVLFTNYPDALPINRNDRRYFILRTSFQTKADLAAFKKERPSYFTDLFNLLDFDWPVLRWWLLTRKISDDFRAKSDAPDTEAKEMMREDSESSDDMSVLEGMLADPEMPLITEEVLVASALRDDMNPLSVLSRRTLGMLLHRAGFAKLGQYRLDGSHDGAKETVYTRRGDLFRGKDPLSTIRGFLPCSDGFD